MKAKIITTYYKYGKITNKNIDYYNSYEDAEKTMNQTFRIFKDGGAIINKKTIDCNNGTMIKIKIKRYL